MMKFKEIVFTLGSLHTYGKTFIYTLGHISIALMCIVLITGSSLAYATIDAIIEPLINGLWFFALESFWREGTPLLKTVVYTMGHIGIACLCIVWITGTDLSYAFIDAVVEPLINAFWYYSLHALWPSNSQNQLLDY